MNNEIHKSFPITLLSVGEKARIVSVEGGAGVRKKLTDLGLIPGKYVQVAFGSGRGPRVLIVDDTKVMIGQGMLQKIRVSL
jgi:ferrous iron transport protein A